MWNRGWLLLCRGCLAKIEWGKLGAKSCSDTVAECESEELALSSFTLSLPVLSLGEHLEAI